MVLLVTAVGLAPSPDASPEKRASTDETEPQLNSAPAKASLTWGDSCGDFIAAPDDARNELFEVDPDALTPTLFVCNSIAEEDAGDAFDTSISSVYADLPTSDGS